MKSLILLVSILLTLNFIQATNTTDTKTKRGLIGQTFYYGEPQTLRYIQTPGYQDSAGSAATNPASGYYNSNNRLVIVQNPNAPIKPEAEATKQVTVQQILYEYQQTPQNILPNIPVNQPFQTATEQKPEILQPQFVNQPNVLSVEPNQYSGIITPVQHGAVIHHGRFSKLNYTPFNIQTHNFQNTLQPKTPYANANFLYQPLQASFQATNNNNHHPAITATIRAQNYLNNFQQRPQVVTQKPFKPSPLIPITYSNNYQTHSPIIRITTTPAPAPAPAPVKQPENEDTEDKEEVREEQEEEDDSEDHSNYEEEEEDDFKPSYFSKYRHEDEDDEDHEHYREDDEDEDNTRSYSRHVKKSPRKSGKGKKEPTAYHKNDHYKFKKGYQKNKEYSSTYKTPETDFVNKKPKNQYKSYKYYKSSSNHSPRKEVIEGHQSQHVPVIHNKKVVHQEKWLITKKD